MSCVISLNEVIGLIMLTFVINFYCYLHALSYINFFLFLLINFLGSVARANIFDFIMLQQKLGAWRWECHMVESLLSLECRIYIIDIHRFGRALKKKAYLLKGHNN